MFPVLKRVYPNANFYADEDGNIWDKRSGVLGQVALEMSSSGYLSLPSDYYGYGKSAHRMTARAFLGSVSGKEVDHINGNKLDNRVSNLQILSRGEHVKKHKKQKHKRVLDQHAEIIIYLAKYGATLVADLLNIPQINVRSIELTKKHLNKKYVKWQRWLLFKNPEVRNRIIKNEKKLAILALY